jgi:hypothetical protein
MFMLVPPRLGRSTLEKIVEKVQDHLMLLRLDWTFTTPVAHYCFYLKYLLSEELLGEVDISSWHVKVPRGSARSMPTPSNTGGHSIIHSSLLAYCKDSLGS